MTKSELIAALNKKLPTHQYLNVESAVNCMLEQMANTLESGERIEIRDFGSFDIIAGQQGWVVIQKQVKSYTYP